jgi:hypothetical protein
MENRVHDFHSKKIRMSPKAKRSAGAFHAIESAPKPYMFTSRTPKRAKPRTMSTSTIRDPGATGPRFVRLNAGPPRIGNGEWGSVRIEGSLDYTGSTRSSGVPERRHGPLRGG